MRSLNKFIKNVIRGIAAVIFSGEANAKIPIQVKIYLNFNLQLPRNTLFFFFCYIKSNV